MSEFVLFWMAKPLAEFFIGLIVIAAFFMLYVMFMLPAWFRQGFCKHPTFNETSACDAICRTCGKNLGFIGNWRKST